MIKVLKIVSMSAALAAGFVVGSGSVDTAPTATATAGKRFAERVPVSVTAMADASAVRAVRADVSCAAQTWPYVAAECLSATDARPRKSVRAITVEQREGANTSVLVRLPIATVASR